MDFKHFIHHLTQNHDFKFYEYNKDKEFSLPYSVKLELKTDMFELKSWGVSSNKDLAFFKAFVELAERSAIHTRCGVLFKKKSFFASTADVKTISNTFRIPISNLFPDNSNGTGCGTSLSMAKKSAFNELVERHTILSALILNIPPQSISYNLADFSLPKQFEVKFYYWRIAKFFVSVCEAREASKGFIYSHSCSMSLNESLTKSFQEIVPNLIFANNVKNVSSHEIIPGDISSFAHYWRFSGDSRMNEFLNSYSATRPGLWSKIPILNDVYFCELDFPKPFDSINKRLRCVRVLSPQAQQLFFDNWNLSLINPLIFRNVSLPTFPHFIS